MPLKFLKKLICALFIICLISLSPLEAVAKRIDRVKVTNISYKRFTVSWVCDRQDTGRIRLYANSSPDSSYTVQRTIKQIAIPNN